MSIHAHPDDQEFTVAGTLAHWVEHGCQVISVIVTSGEAGNNDPSRGENYKAELRLIRQEEQCAACSLLGIETTIFLDYPDGELEATLDLRRDITRLMRKYKPEAVVIGDPQGVFYGNGYINHPDHRAAAQAALYAAFPSSGTRLIFTELLAEGLEPHNVARVYIHGAEKSDTWVDISLTLEKKIAALKMHVSQLGDWDPTQWIREWAEESGKSQDLQFAEEYKVMILSQDGKSD